MRNKVTVVQWHYHKLNAALLLGMSFFWIHRSLVSSSEWISSLRDRLSSILHLLFRSYRGFFHSIKGLPPQKEELAVDQKNK